MDKNRQIDKIKIINCYPIRLIIINQCNLKIISQKEIHFEIIIYIQTYISKIPIVPLTSYQQQQR